MSTTDDGVYFAQITDIHVGNNTLNGEAAKRNLRWALAEIAALQPQPRCILATADLVCSGRRAELEEYRGLVAGAALPIHALPANHDLWGETGDAVWQELIGPLRQVVEVGELRLILLQDIRRKAEGGWRAQMPPAELEWLRAQLGAWPRGRSVVAIHAPILRQADDFHDVWREGNAEAFLTVLREHQVLALLTGHWHRVNEWSIDGVRLINAGSLVGWQWTGIPPYYSFPVRAGYMLYHYRDGVLRGFWRELVSQENRPDVQANLVRIGPVHTGGPRPQVRPAEVFSRVRLSVQTCALTRQVEAVEWSLVKGQWQAMTKSFCGLWSEWEAELEPRAFRCGEQVLAIRAISQGKPAAYDAVPVRLAEAQSPPLVAAQAGAETVFELYYLPE
jgi:hypothetical protein